MDADGIVTLLRKLGCSKIHIGSKFVNAACPFAPWKHGSGIDSNPSFGIKIEPNGASRFNCKACFTKGMDLRHLLWQLGAKTGEDFSKLDEWVRTRDAVSLEAVTRRMVASKNTKPAEVAGIVMSASFVNQMQVEEVELPTLPEAVLEPLKDLAPEVQVYLRKRGLSDKSVKQFGIGWHPGSRRVSIPIRDIKGRLVGLSGRAFDSGTKPKFLHSRNFHRDYYLYGEHGCQTGGVGFLVEGFFDVMFLRQHGYSAVGIMGGHLSVFQIEKITRMFREVVIVPDGDEPGEKIAEEALMALSRRMTARRTDAVEGKDPDEWTEAQRLEMLGPPTFVVDNS